MADSPVPEGHRSMRLKMRNATFIEPKTGRSTRRTFSLHSPQADGPTDFEHNGERTPLLLRLPTLREETTPTSRVGRVRRAMFKQCHTFITFAKSDTGKAVFKCALAYLLGSMCTFIPALASLLGRADSKHTVATITVYFHPARSRGSMLKALVCAFSAFLYTAIVSISSMTVSVLFTDHFHQVVLGHIIVLLVFVGGGLGVVGWVKLKKGDPLVSISCSLTSLSLISVLTSEGAVQIGDLSFKKIGLYLKMIVAGVTATMLVSFLVLPVSARKQFKKSTVDVTDALSDMLGIITSSFLSGNESELQDQQYTSADEKQRKSTATLNQYLAESGYELKVIGCENEAQIQTRVVKCVQQITQSIGGLRSAAAMQFIIIKQPAIENTPQESDFLQYPTSIATTPAMSPEVERQLLLGNDLGARLNEAFRSINGTAVRTETSSKFSLPRQIFELFIENLGPSMRSLAFTMKEILDDLPFDPERNYAVENNPAFRHSLECALELYKEARQRALEQVYNRRDMNRNRPLAVEADWEEAAACCGHFSFSLLEVAEQLKQYLVVLDELEVEIEERPSGRSWRWLKFWKRSEGEEKEIIYDRSEPDKVHSDAYSMPVKKLKRKKPIYAEALQSMKPTATFKRRVFRKIYDMFSFFRRDDKKFAIKVGLGAVLYAVPSYLDSTRPIYKQWRGEWGLLSYMLVCSMTIGASNTTGLQRFWGTCLGALLAITAWHVAGTHAVPLAFFGFIMAYWTAYIIVGQGKGPLGRFIMLTYNLTALYAYTLSAMDDDDDGDEEDSQKNPEILVIALHRVVTVLTGCLWGLIITRAVWPISARRKVRDGLSLLWLRMGLIWKRDPLSVFIHGESQHTYMNLREEMELQGFHSQLQVLCTAAQHEFALRRPFPAEAYTRILRSTARMLEAFHTMNIVILKDLKATEGEVALLNTTASERAQLCSRISHQFSVLASSIKLEYSLATEALPNTEHTRDRLLAKVFAFRKDQHRQTQGGGQGPGHQESTSTSISIVNSNSVSNSDINTQTDHDTRHDGNPESIPNFSLSSSNHDDDNNRNDTTEGGTTPTTTKDEDFGLLYTYALVTGLIGSEIETCLKEIEALFGSLDEESLWLQ